MPAIGADRVTVLWDEGASPRWAIYKVRNFSGGDTLDVSNRFAATVELASLVTGQTTTVYTVTSTTAAVLTLGSTAAGQSTGATGFLSVRGQSSTGVII